MRKARKRRIRYLLGRFGYKIFRRQSNKSGHSNIFWPIQFFKDPVLVVRSHFAFINMASTALKFPAPTGLPFGVPNLAATVPKTSKTYKQVLNDGVSSEAVLLSMKGTRIRIPNLRAPMGHWPHAVHPQIDQLDDDVQKKLDS